MFTILCFIFALILSDHDLTNDIWDNIPRIAIPFIWILIDIVSLLNYSIIIGILKFIYS